MQSQVTRYCAGCMSKMSEAGPCSNPDCRWDEHAEVETQEHLPRHYILLDRYYIGRVLGQGGFGVTYIAQDLKLDRTVAIKEFLPKDQCSRRTDRVTVHSFSQEKGEQFRFGLQRFLTEAQNIAKLGGHPNIVSITDYAEANGTAYMVMEFIPGVTLKQYLIDHGGSIPYAVASEIVLHIMAGLSKAHEHGLIHRDVSPDNIMISSLGPIKLIDFGAARQAVGERSQNLTMALKPGYAPEEQYRSRGEQGPWTDVYATAATLYRCITGHVPPAAPDRLAEDDLVSPSLICKDLPAAAEAAILKGLTVRAVQRPQSIREFRQLLIGQVTEPATSSEVTLPLPQVQQEAATVAIRSPGSSAVQAAGIRLFTPRAVWLASFFGTALGGCIVLAINFSRLRKPSSAFKAIASGVVLIVAISVAAALSPASEIWSAIFIGVQVGLAAMLSGLAKQWQGEQVKQNQALGAKRSSYWAAFGIGLATVIVPIMIGWPIAYYQAMRRIREESYAYTPGGLDSGGTGGASTPSDGSSSQPAGSGADSSLAVPAQKELTVGKGTLDYWSPITDGQAQDVGKLMSDYFDEEGSHLEIRQTDQGTQFNVTVTDKSDEDEISSGQDDEDGLWVGRMIAEQTVGYPATFHFFSSTGKALRDIAVDHFAGLFGTVFNPSGHDTESKAVVTVTSSATGESSSFETGEIGMFHFPNLPPGAYTLSVQAMGASEFQRVVTIPSDGTAYIEVDLTAASSQ